MSPPNLHHAEVHGHGHRATPVPERRARRVLPALWLWLATAAPLAASTSAAEHRAHFDALFDALLEQHDVPGLAAVLVQDDTIVFQAGYGLADVAQRRPVDPERTLFPLGSVSKLLTTIAVLQLAEEGTVELDADIRTYLGPVQVDRRFAAPVTLRHLLTHTDGFDVRWVFGGAARVPEKVLPLPRLLAELPPRVMPPGEIYLYGDVGMTVAGYVVERVVQQPFAEYVERRIFTPLGMTGSSFRSGRDFYARDRATGYDYNHGGVLRPVAIVYPHAVPASGLTAPVADMGPLLLALLRTSDDGPGGVLRTSSLQTLWQRQFSHHPDLAGTSYGFYEYTYQGRRALVHGGLLPGFTSLMVLLPEARVGLCVAANRFALIEPLEINLTRRLIERFTPEPLPAVPATSHAESNVPPVPHEQLAGVYRCDQYSRLSPDKMLVLAGLGADIEVKAEADGRLLFEPEGVHWRPVAPLVFEREDTGDRITFQLDAGGRPIRILGSAQLMSYHRVGPADDVRLHTYLGGALVLLACVAGPAAALATGRRRLFPLTRGRAWPWLLPALAVAVALGWVAFAAGFVGVLRHLEFATAAFGEPPALGWVRLIPLACAAGAIAQLALLVPAYRRRLLAAPTALAYSAAAMATLLLLPLLAQWQLVRLPAPAFAFLARCLSLLAS